MCVSRCICKRSFNRGHLHFFSKKVCVQHEIATTTSMRGSHIFSDGNSYVSMMLEWCTLVFLHHFCNEVFVVNLTENIYVILTPNDWIFQLLILIRPVCETYKNFPLQFILNGRLRIVFHHSKYDCTHSFPSKKAWFWRKFLPKINCDIGLWACPHRHQYACFGGKPSRLR